VVRTLCVAVLVAILLAVGEGRTSGAVAPLIAFVGESDVRVMNADGSRERSVSPGVNFSWAPDGRHLVVVRPGFSLHVVPISGGRARPLGPGVQADWSPDASKLVFVRDHAIYVVAADGRHRRRLTSPPKSAQDYGPDWSPDGRRIAWVRTLEISEGEVDRAFVMNADGTRQRIVNAEAEPYSVSWSGDGKVLLCSCWFGNNYDIALIPVDGSRVRYLTPEYANDEDPAWSPDGKSIVFTRLAGPKAGEDVHVIRLDGSGRRRLTRTPGFDGDASWSPDGRQLAFMSARDGSYDIYVMSADGLTPRNLTRDGPNVHDSHPAWQPTP
jgi:TolB protein